MKNHFKVFFFLTLFLFSKILIAGELIGIDVEQLKTMQPQALVVDIRSAQEVAAQGIIPGSKAIQFFDADGNYDAKAWLDKLNEYKQSDDQAVILVCLGGVRSARVGNFLVNQIGMDGVHHLEGGLSSWKSSGNSTIKPQSP